MAIVAILCAITVLMADRTIVQGTGLIVATLAAGAGWLFRDVNDEARALRNICQAYAALIESQFEEIYDALSDRELARFLKLAPEIAAGGEAEALGVRQADPFAALPSTANHLHLLSPLTIRLLSKWRVRGIDLFGVYDQLGTKALSKISEQRLVEYFEWVKEYRDEYRDIAYMALLQLEKDTPGLTVDVAPLLKAGAKEIG